MKRTTFYGRCFHIAITSGYAWASLVSLVATVGGGYAAYLHPEWGDKMTLLLWIVPLAVFLGTAIVAWNLAPYAIYSERDRSYHTLETSTASVISALEERLHAIETSPRLRRADLGDIQQAITEIYEASCGRQMVSWSAFMDWYEEVTPRLRETLRPSKFNEFEATAQNYISGSFSNKDGREKAAYRDCLRWLDRTRNEIRAEHINANFKVPE